MDMARSPDSPGTLRGQCREHAKEWQRRVSRAAHPPVWSHGCLMRDEAFRRDQRETASVVARELMCDDTVPRHVRARAARDLARWSELCREEARELLRTLGTDQ
jgi:hypothetical protein